MADYTLDWFYDRLGDVEYGPAACWPWPRRSQHRMLPAKLASLPDGYAHDGRRPLHRVSYELHVGPIPEGLELDHVRARGCTMKRCVNPAHLEPVTSSENQRRRRPKRQRAGLIGPTR